MAYQMDTLLLYWPSKFPRVIPSIEHPIFSDDASTATQLSWPIPFHLNVYLYLIHSHCLPVDKNIRICLTQCYDRPVHSNKHQNCL